MPPKRQPSRPLFSSSSSLPTGWNLDRSTQFIEIGPDTRGQKLEQSHETKPSHTRISDCDRSDRMARDGTNQRTFRPSARAATTQKPNKADQQFLSKAIQGDISEINMGKLAQDKGQSDDVKQFGKMLEQDHGAHLQKAQQMAGQMGANAPSQPDAKSKATYDKLSATPDAQFDSKFAQAMASDHKHEIAAYKLQAKSKGPLADFATETMPTLEQHLKTAESADPGETVSSIMKKPCPKLAPLN